MKNTQEPIMKYIRTQEATVTMNNISYNSQHVKAISRNI